MQNFSETPWKTLSTKSVYRKPFVRRRPPVDASRLGCWGIAREGRALQDGIWEDHEGRRGGSTSGTCWAHWLAHLARGYPSAGCGVGLCQVIWFSATSRATRRFAHLNSYCSVVTLAHGLYR